MSNVTAGMVKELRERTGVGMAKCKEALDACHGDMEKAIDFLRKAGMASAVKKEARETNEGLVASAEDAHGIALVEINSETDFVVQNEKFQTFLHAVANAALHAKAHDLAHLASAHMPSSSKSVEEARVDLVASMGENIQIRRVVYVPKHADASYGIYMHMGGKIACLVEITGSSSQAHLAKEIGMHIAAEAPEYLSSHEVPRHTLEREEEIAREQIKGKPENVVAKIVEGKMKAFYEQVCLVCQKYVKDTAHSVEEFVAKTAPGCKVTRFIRWQVGA